MSDNQKPVVFLAFANAHDDRSRYLRNLPEEARRLQDTLERARQDGLCDNVVRQNATVQDVLNVFQSPEYRDRIAVFHFGGHANGYQLLLESSEGAPAAADAGGLARFLGQQTGLQLVFLNGCSTQQQVHGLLDAGVSAVIATSHAIQDQVAMDFADRFYRGLAGGANIRTAYSEAEAAVQTAGGSNTRDAYRVEAPLGDRWPWDLHLRDGAEAAARWNLPEAVDDPLFGLPPLPEQDLPASPFRHLNWFTREHAEIFFGRGHEIRALFDRVTAPQTSPIILFYGQSGVGKTSLLAAGLLPRLESSREVRYLRRDQEQGLLGALQEALPAGSPAQAWREMEAQFGRPAVIILDQVEEVFTRPRPDEPGELENLLAALQPLFVDREQRPQGRLILGFRKEWLAEIEEHLRERRLPYTRVFLEPLGRRGVMEAVAGVARSERLQAHYGLTVEDGLPEIIADDLLEDPDSPIAPTLQILLTKMWNEARDRDYEHPHFDCELYQGLKKEGILLSDFLDQQLKALEAWNADVVESGLALDVLAFHTTPLGTAQVQTTERLEQTYSHRWDVLPSLLQRCQDLYLLVKLSQRQGQLTATRLSHDTLAPLVRKQYDESDRPGQRARRILENRSVEWAGGGEGTPLDAQDLGVVEAGQAGMRAWTGAEERLIAASRTERARRERNRQILRGAGVVAVLLILMSAVVASWQWQEAAEQRNAAVASKQQAIDSGATAVAEANQRATAVVDARAAEATAAVERIRAEQEASEARRALSGQLTLQAQAVLEEHPHRSLLLAVEALQATMREDEPRVPAAEQVLRDALATKGGLGLAGHQYTITAVAISRDSHWLVTASLDATARLWDLTAKDLAAEPIVLRGHEDGIRSVAISPDSHWLVTGSWDNTARLWDLTAEDPAAEPIVLAGHQGDITAVAISRDSHWLVTGSGWPDNTARLWDLTAEDPAAEPIVLAGHQDFITAVAISRDSHWLVTGSGDNTARLWDVSALLNTGVTAEDPVAESMVLADHQDTITAVAISPDSHWLVTGSGDNTARLWDLTAEDPAAEPMVLAGHQDTITAVVISRDSHWLVTASGDNTARLWDLTAEDPAAEPMVLAGHQGEITAVAISRDSHWLVTGSLDATARLWDLTAEDPAAEPIVLRRHEGSIGSVAISPDSHWLVIAGVDPIFGSGDNTARLWDVSALLNTGVTAEDPVAESMVLAGHQYLITAVAISPDSHWLVTGSGDNTARLWDLTAEDPAAEPMVLAGHEDGIRSVAISPDSHWLVTGSWDATARLWDLTAEDPAAEPMVLAGHQGEITAVAISRDSHWLVTAGWDATARLWDLTAEDPAADPIVLTGHQDFITAVAISRDSHWLVTGSGDNTARLWDVSALLNTGVTAEDPVAESMVLRGHADDITAVAISPDGHWLVTGSQDATARLWDLTADDPAVEPIVLRGHEGGIGSVAISRDSHWLVTGSLDATARLWDLTAEDPAAEPIVLAGHESAIGSVAISRDSHWLVTGSGWPDNTARLWDLTAEDPAAEPIVLRGHQYTITAVAISPDSHWLVTGSGDDTARLWNLRLEELVDLACRTAGRNLTQEEWDQYFRGQDYRRTCPKLPIHPSVVSASP